MHEDMLITMVAWWRTLWRTSVILSFSQYDATLRVEVDSELPRKFNIEGGKGRESWMCTFKGPFEDLSRTLIASKAWGEIFKKINVNDQNTFKRLAEAERVANLGLEDDQILLVRIASGYSDVHQVTTLALSIGDEALVDEVPELEFNDIIPGLTVVLRTILSKVSVVFRDMFDLPNAAPELSSPLETDNQRHGLSVIQDVANDAANQTLCFLQGDVLVDESALKDITGEQYHRLIQYRRDCVRRATNEPQITWFSSLSSPHPTPITSSSCRTQFHFFSVCSISPPRSLWVPHWWTTYLHKALHLLKDRPCGGTVVSFDLLEYFFDSTGFFPDCQEGKAALKKFSSALAKEVEKAIAQARTINLLTRIPLLTSNGFPSELMI
ncbi:hypothetical protein F5888DRAFT_1635600 [Russula emetica]|nr:hypothetical protein F5888DRAFT_1635600 [Russula emetica]